MRRIIPLLAVSAALFAVQQAFAVGPSLWTVEGTGISTAGGDVSYVPTLNRQGGTAVSAVRISDSKVLRSVTLKGHWGLQAVTTIGDVAGLSADGRTLVLARTNPGTGMLRAATTLAVLSTQPLALRGQIHLRGDFTIDALSPDGKTLYLIQHVGGSDISNYRVRAYDLQSGRLLPQVIADKRQAGWTMRGYPISRTARTDGSWVYTLYQPGANYPFIHALDTVHHTAVCIGLPLKWDGNTLEGAELKLDESAHRLTVSGPHVASPIALDTQTLTIVR
jgi:hypothetical protein